MQSPICSIDETGREINSLKGHPGISTHNERREIMVYREQLQNICKDLKEQKRQLENEQEYLPEGYLNIRKYKGKNYYTWQIPKKGRRKKIYRKGITRDKDQINKLVRKRYLDGALLRIDRNISLLEKMTEQYKNFDEASVMVDYIKKHPDLREGLRYGNMSNEEWAADYRKPVGFYEDGLKSTDSSGSRMRSKGEIIIASRLDFFGIPYRYEARIPHPHVNRVPDFTIRRPRDGKIFYWEHLGRVSDARYLEENIRKLKQYAEIGITPWDNLIITYDQEDGGIDVKKIDAIIKGWLL